jgi:serine/threonine protein kinase
MNTPDFRGPDREQRLNEILLNYVEAIQQGHAPDRRLLLALYPEFAADLSDFFAGRDQMEALAVPLRQASPAGFFRLKGPGLLGDSTQDFVDKPLASGSPNPALPPYLSRTSAGPELGQLGDFQLLREIGRGGMGIVYEAQQISLNRRVALKVLPFAAAFDPKQLQRFKNEAQAAAQLHHNNIVPVFAIGYERGVNYYAMQFIEGQSLAAMIRELRDLTAAEQAPSPDASPVLSDDEAAPNSVEQFIPEERKRVPPNGSGKVSIETATAAGEVPTERSAHTRRFYRRVAELGKTAANALEIAHQQGVIHRDIKPANLLVDARGNLWITDFGLALFQNEGGITLTGEVLGTLRYMSPEQALGKRALVDRRTDIYSLGVTLYELLTLAPVFDGQDRQELMHQIANEEPRLPRAVQKSIPVELETIVLKAIAKNPIERYATAQEFADDLQRFLEDKPILAKRPTVWDKAMKWSRRHRSVVVWAGVLLALIFVGSLFGILVIAQEHSQTLEAYKREQARTEEAQDKTREAEVQRARAEESFRQARRAVDFFTLILDEKLAGNPELQSVRRELLEAALEYYQSFIEQRGDDPSLQKELAASYARVANILSELGADFDSLAASEKARRMYEKLISEYPTVVEFQSALATINQHAWRVQGVWELGFLTNDLVQEDLSLS